MALTRIHQTSSDFLLQFIELWDAPKGHRTQPERRERRRVDFAAALGLQLAERKCGRMGAPSRKDHHGHNR